VAARYYWLYSELSRIYRLHFNVVTLECPPYITPSVESEPLISTRVVSAQSDRPWTIPEVDLAVERLCSTALEYSKSYKPDIIECNYLAPYGIASVFIAQYLKCPLILRPASSDIVKLLAWPEIKHALNSVFNLSDVVLLPPERIKLFKNTTISSRSKILPVLRYVPSPFSFSPSPASRKRILLVAGKINYYWRLKALDTLLSAICDCSEWHLRLAIGGKYCNDFIDLLNAKLDPSRYTLTGFVHPAQMPDLIKKSWAVWNVQRNGGVEDFPNMHWEALAIGRYSFVSTYVSQHPDMDDTCYHRLVIKINPDDAISLKKKFLELPSPDFSIAINIQNKFTHYLKSHNNIYKSLY
jgi:hypothetical protein